MPIIKVEQPIETDTSGFPSPFLSPAVKATPEYGYKWCYTADSVDRRGMSSNLFRGRTTDYQEQRSYARGNQSIDRYKPQLRVNQKTKNNPNPTSYKILDWTVLAVLPKFVNLLVGKLIAQNNDVGINAIDKRAQDEKRAKKVNLQEYIVNKTFLDSVTTATGIPFEAPGQDGVVPPPNNPGEIDMYMDMFYKERYCLVMQDMLKLLNEQDNYKSILKECATDFVEVGIAATKVYRIGKRIKRRRCIIERMVASATTKDNFEDCQYIGEYWDLTIGQLKELAGSQFTEEEYKVIAEQSTGTNFGAYNIRDYYDKNLSYPWDNSKCTVLDLTWWSPDEEVYLQKTNRIGNVEVYEKVQGVSSYDWWQGLKGKGVTEKSFNSKGDGNQVIVNTVNNQYQCMWIVKTKAVFNYGKSKDMLKNESSIGTCIGPYCIQSMKVPLMPILKPIADNIQLNWLQYQHHAAKSIPDGVAVEFSALQDISIEGKGGKAMTPKAVMELYFDTGVLLWRRRDAAGNQTNWNPVTKMANGLSPACRDHFLNVVNGIDMLRNILGENDLTDASTPSGEMGKEIAKMAGGASKDAQRYLHYAFDEVNIGTHQRTVMHISGMAATGMAPDYTEALGLDNIGFLGLMSDIGAHEYGCYLMKQATPEMKARLSMYTQQGLMSVPPSLYPEEAFEIENEPNIFRAIQLLKLYRVQKRQIATQEQAQTYQMEAQKNAASTQASEQEKRQTQQELYQHMTDFEMVKAQAEVWKSKQIVGDEAFMLNLKYKLETKKDLSIEEQERLTDLAKVRLQGNFMLEAKRLEPPKPAAKK